MFNVAVLLDSDFALLGWREGWIGGRHKLEGKKAGFTAANAGRDHKQAPDAYFFRRAASNVGGGTVEERQSSVGVRC